MEFTVREVTGSEPKSVQEFEKELLEKHEESQEGLTTPVIELENVEPIEPIEPIVPNVEEEDLSEEKVLSYLGKRYGREITSLEELAQQREETEEMDEEVKTYLKYKKETGRGFDDFKQLNKDYESLSAEERIRAYLKETNVGLDEDDIDVLMEDFSYDEDLDDDSDNKKVKLKIKKMDAEAKSYLNQMKEKYRVPLESSVKSTPEVEDEDYKAYKQYMQQAKTEQEESERRRAWFEQKTDELFSGEFKGFEFNLDDKKFTFSPGDSSELKKLQANPLSFISKYVGEDGLMKDVAGYHRSLSIALNPEKFAKFFYEQGKAEGTDDITRKIKNIDMSERKSPEVINNSSVQVKAVNPDAGRSLKIRSIKRV